MGARIVNHIEFEGLYAKRDVFAWSPSIVYKIYSEPCAHDLFHRVRLVSFGLVPAGGCSRGAGSSSRAGGCSRWLVLPAELNAAQFLIQILAPNECVLVNSNFGTKWMRTYARLSVLSSCIHTTE